MALFSLANWPLLFLSVAMIVAAVIDAWKFKVPSDVHRISKPMMNPASPTRLVMNALFAAFEALVRS